LRVTQGGLLAPDQVRWAAWAAFAGAAATGLYLVAHAGWPIAVLGAAAIAAGWAYTGGPWPLGYLGLGDLLVFIFFGFAAVVGTYYVQAGAAGGLVWALSIPVGALATAILVVNNVRDCDTDREAGKRTLAVRFGERFGRAEYGALLAIAYLVPTGLWATGTCGPWILLPWVAAPRALGLAGTVMRCTDARSFNAALGGTARLHGEFGALLAAGISLAG
jgi:1,4-dihydroxy-2-naphthoate octaprenyltransferase